MGQRSFCGISEAVRSKDSPLEAKMGTNRPTWCLQATLKQFSDAQLRQVLADAFGRWTRVCDVDFSETTNANGANFLIIDRNFGDGPSGVLADCQLPYGGQQLMRLDNATNWVASKNPPANSVDLIAVAAHEMGHGIGLMHLTAGGQADLMEPYYRPGLQDPQKAETALVVAMYGAAKVAKPPLTPAPPLGDSLGVEIIIRAAGQEWVAKGEAKRK